MDWNNEYLHILTYARFIRNFKFLAYSNEVGESFRHTFPKVIIPAYAMSFGYVFTDSLHHIYPTYKKHGFKKETIDKIKFFTFWHGVASLALPTLVIGGGVKGTKLLLKSMKASARTIRWTVPLVGIGMIPFVIHPIDYGTDKYLMQPMFKEKIFGDWVGDYYLPFNHHLGEEHLNESENKFEKESFNDRN